LLAQARILLAGGRLNESQELIQEALTLAERLNLPKYVHEARSLEAGVDGERRVT
jgi:hypothetical protein